MPLRQGSKTVNIPTVSKQPRMSIFRKNKRYSEHVLAMSKRSSNMNTNKSHFQLNMHIYILKQQITATSTSILIEIPTLDIQIVV